ncbi:MAG: hypothetical protein WA709_02975 [Stellaceae bacterium]
MSGAGRQHQPSGISGAGKFLGVGGRRRLLDHIGRLIWPRYRAAAAALRKAAML